MGAAPSLGGAAGTRNGPGRACAEGRPQPPDRRRKALCDRHLQSLPEASHGTVLQAGHGDCDRVLPRERPEPLRV